MYGIFLSIYKLSLQFTFSAADFSGFTMKLQMISSGLQQRQSATAAAAYYGITRKLLSIRKMIISTMSKWLNSWRYLRVSAHNWNSLKEKRADLKLQHEAGSHLNPQWTHPSTVSVYNLQFATFFRFELKIRKLNRTFCLVYCKWECCYSSKITCCVKWTSASRAIPAALKTELSIYAACLFISVDFKLKVNLMNPTVQCGSARLAQLLLV